MMARNRLSVTGAIGFVVSMLGCVTPTLVALVAALGVSGSAGWLDWILLPLMGLFAALAVYGIVCRFRDHRISN